LRVAVVDTTKSIALPISFLMSVDSEALAAQVTASIAAVAAVSSSRSSSAGTGTITSGRHAFGRQRWSINPTQPL